MKPFILSTLFLLLLLTNNLFSQPKSDYTQQFKSVDSLFIPWANNSTPGCAVGIYKDGELIYKKGFGIANLEYDIPIQHY